MNPDPVYPPQEDTWLLLRAAKKEVRVDDTVLEIGTGSGWIAASLPQTRMIVATDINPYAVKMAKSRGLVVIRTDLAAGIRRRFSLILCNPPYLPTKAGERIDDWLEYALDGGLTGNDVIFRVINALPELLSVEGRALLLISSLNHIETVLGYCQKRGLEGRSVDAELLSDGEWLYVLRITRDYVR